jgi:hypothetical protein
MFLLKENLSIFEFLNKWGRHILIRIFTQMCIIEKDLKSIINIIIWEVSKLIKINTLYHLNKKKANRGRPEILIIMDKIINLFEIVKLIHEEKLHEE